MKYIRCKWPSTATYSFANQAAICLGNVQLDALLSPCYANDDFRLEERSGGQWGRLRPGRRSAVFVL